MKKEINSKSRRKWIMGGLAAFASVALLTTGFAVWVVGSNKTADKGDVNVTVDTAQNESVVFKFNLDETDSAIELKEDGEKKGKMVHTKDVTDGNPLQIKYKASTIKFGANYDFKFKSIKFSIEDPTDMKNADETGPAEDAGDYASVKVADKGKLTGAYARKGTGYTYLEAPKAIKLPTVTKATSGTTTVNIDSGVLNFTWGSFYNNAEGKTQSPADFYNNTFAAATDDQIADHADEVEGEYADLRANFIKSQSGETVEWKKLKLVATLSEEAVA